MREKMEGIVIKSIDYKENSKIVYLYTSKGIKSILARGAKIFKNGLFEFTEIANCLEFEYSETKMPFLISYNTVLNFRKSKNDFNKILYISSIIELINQIDSSANHERIYLFLKRTLVKIEDDKYSKLSYIIFLIKFLKVFGIEPNFSSCVMCGKTVDFTSFSLENGGFICDNCTKFNSKYLSIGQTLKNLYYFDDINGNYQDIMSFDLNEILSVILKYYRIHSSLYLKSFNLISSKVLTKIS